MWEREADANVPRLLCQDGEEELTHFANSEEMGTKAVPGGRLRDRSSSKVLPTDSLSPAGNTAKQFMSGGRSCPDFLRIGN
jgi:hypothetical protein